MRVRINAKFTEFVNDELRDKKEDRQLPDITHIVAMPDKERIDYVTFKEYEEDKYYIDVAMFNRLNNFRKIPVNYPLVLPSLEQKN